MKTITLPTDVKNYILPYEYSALKKLYALFGDAELYLVGGCVRDMLLNKKPKDIDLCTNLSPDEMIALLDDEDKRSDFHIIETGLKHGTVTFRSSILGVSFEVTTYRVDGDYADHRRPDEVTFTSLLEEDLKRRDLTINSFAAKLVFDNDDSKLEILMLDESYLSDLQFGIIRAVGDPNKRFEEDALRMLRAIRFAAQLGFTLDFDTFNAIVAKADTISYVSHERIGDELTKILVSDFPQMLELTELSGLSRYIGLPLTELKNEPQHNKYHYTDVFHHTLDVIKATKKDPVIRWAALFHDWGKIDTVSTDEEGWQHYYGHPEKSAERARAFMEDYKFDNHTIEAIYTLVKYHDAAIGCQVSRKGMKKLINNVSEDLMPMFFNLTFADRLAHKLDNTMFSIAQLDSGKKKYIDITTSVEPMRLKDLALKGDDLVKIGLVGKQIGTMLNILLEQVLECPEMNEKEALTAFVNEHKGDLR